jgi:hypothetical protein
VTYMTTKAVLLLSRMENRSAPEKRHSRSKANEPVLGLIGLGSTALLAQMRGTLGRSGNAPRSAGGRSYADEDDEVAAHLAVDALQSASPPRSHTTSRRFTIFCMHPPSTWRTPPCSGDRE